MGLVRLVFKLGLVVMMVACFGLAVLYWSFNNYLSKPESLEKVRVLLSDVVGTPVQFTKLEVNVFRGAQMSDVQMDNAPGATAPKLAEVAQISLAYYLPALLQKRLEITQINLASPQVVLLLGPDNKLILPQAQPKPESLAEASPTAGDLARAEISFKDSLEIEVKSLNITNGALSIKAADGAERFSLTGLNNDAQIKGGPSGISAQGQARIAALQVDKLLLSSVQSPYTYEQGVLKLPNITGQAYRGNLTGAFEQNVQDSELPYTFKLNGTGLDLNEMLKQLALKPDMISGQFSATTNWRGAMTNPRGISGKGNFEVTNGQLIKLAFFRQLSEVLGIKELAQPDFTKCRSEFTVENEVVTVSSLVLNSTFFDFTTSGTVGFDTKLGLQCEMVLKPELVKLLPALVADRLTPRDDGARTVAFNVTGTTEAPESDLWLKIALGPSGQPQELIKQGVEAIRNLFR